MEIIKKYIKKFFVLKGFMKILKIHKKTYFDGNLKKIYKKIFCVEGFKGMWVFA